MAKKAPKRRPTRRNSRANTPTPDGHLRLNKILATAGLGSRRDVEELIVQGRVEIDGEVTTNLACKVDPREVTIKVDGVALKKPRLVYYALNKPTGVLSTNYDPSGRMRVIDFVPDTDRVFSVGRLDRSSEGLMLLTNDGDLAQRLAHPKFGVQKSYFVVVAGVMTAEELAKLHKGVYLAEGVARIDGATIRKHRKGCTEIEIVLSEGKNREIRRILARAGHKVVTLRRIAIGPLRLGDLPVGAARILTPSEVKALYSATEQTKSKKSAQKKSAMKSPVAKPGSGVATKPDKVRIARPAVEDDEFGMDDDFGFQSIAHDDDFPDSNELAIDGELISSGGWDEDYDDDFVGGFSAKTGTVLGFDEDPVHEPQDTDIREGSAGKFAKHGDRSTPRRSGRGNSRGGAKAGRSKLGSKSTASRPKRAQGTTGKPTGNLPRGGKTNSNSATRSGAKAARPSGTKSTKYKSSGGKSAGSSPKSGRSQPRGKNR